MFHSRARLFAVLGTGAIAAALAPASASAVASDTYYQGQLRTDGTNRVWTATGGVGGKVVYAVANGSTAQQWSEVQAAGRPAGDVNYVNRASGLCLDIDKSGTHGGLTTGVEVIQQTCNGSVSQVWEKEYHALLGADAVQNQFSFYFLSVKDASESNNATLIQDGMYGPWGGGFHQYWKFLPVS
ncbi:RICIN domain-containing protein [Kribbella sp. CA-253562]|uniref:RICIN domain-containing protein n=1 Tax=Kribbella sp. CA-253562 TaxID=3239942 RepID=UPI003D94FEFA